VPSSCGLAGDAVCVRLVAAGIVVVVEVVDVVLLVLVDVDVVVVDAHAPTVQAAALV
jgi:hypothetical protein